MEDLGEEELRSQVARDIGYNEVTTRKPKGRALWQEFTVLAAPDPGLGERCVSWLCSLSPIERLRALSIRDPWFASMLRQMFSCKVERGDLIFSYTEEKDWQPLKPYSAYFYQRVRNVPLSPEAQEAERDLERALRMTDWGWYIDTITVDPALAADFPRFLHLMSQISRAKAFTSPCKLRQAEDTKAWFIDSPCWLFSGFNSLSVWAGVWLERGIWINFWKSIRPDPRYDILDESKSVLLEDLPLLCNFWGGLSQDQKEELLHTTETAVAQYTSKPILQWSTVNIESNGKSLRVGNYHKSTGNYYQKYFSLIERNNSPEAVEDLRRKSRENPKTFVEFLVLSTLDRALTTLDILSRQLYLKLTSVWKQQLTRNLLEELTSSPQQTATNTGNKKKKRNKQKIKETVLVEDPGEKREICEELVKMVVEMAIQQGKKDSAYWPFVAQPSSANLLAKMKELNPTESKPKKTKKKKNKKTKKPQNGEVLGAQLPVKKHSRLHMEITSYCQDLTRKLQTLESVRVELITRLREACGELFPGSEVVVYGSYPSGLALESSDIDTVVVGVRKEEHTVSLQRLGSTLRSQPWVSDLTVIDTASVPIIKLKALSEGQITKLDITFDDRRAGDTGTHRGIERLSYTTQLLRELKPLRELTVVVKGILARHNMNSAYRGFLSSYSVMLWTAARLQTQTRLDLGELLSDFFTFYSSDFFPQQMGIDLTQSE